MFAWKPSIIEKCVNSNIHVMVFHIAFKIKTAFIFSLQTFFYSFNKICLCVLVTVYGAVVGSWRVYGVFPGGWKVKVREGLTTKGRTTLCCRRLT